MRIVALVLTCLVARLQANPPPGNSTDIDASIIGGQLARPTQFPFIVALLRNNRPMCAGSLISATHVLTAAHCVISRNVRVPASQMKVRVGSNRFSAGGQLIAVLRITPHPRFAPYNYDVAVMRLARAVRTTRRVRPIVMRRTAVPAGARVTIAGWGLTQVGGRPSDQLRFLGTVAMSDRDCWTALRAQRPTVLCLRSPVGQGACRGDSGGPAIAGGQLVGVTSFARATCATAMPDGYAKLSVLYTWIRANMT